MTKVKYFLKGVYVATSIIFIVIEAFVISVFHGLWKDEKERRTKKEENKYRVYE